MFLPPEPNNCDNPAGTGLQVSLTSGSDPLTELSQAQCIGSSLRANWFWPGVNGGLPAGVSGAIEKGGMWQPHRPANLSSTGLPIWPNFNRALARDSECAINPGLKPSGVVSAGTSHTIIPQNITLLHRMFVWSMQKDFNKGHST